MLENLFSIEQAQGEENFKQELEEDIKLEVEASIGPLERIEVFNQNPRGVAKLKFRSAIHAGECLKVMDGRFFAERRIKAYFWDGKTDFRKVKESEEQEQDRVDRFGDWLLAGEIEETKKEEDLEGAGPEEND